MFEDLKNLRKKEASPGESVPKKRGRLQLAAIENINIQIDTISKELAKYGWDSDDVKILLSITGIDVFSAMLIATEIVDVRRFCTPWKLVSYAGLAPSYI